MLSMLHGPPNQLPQAAWEKLCVGQSSAEVRALLGEPTCRSRQIIAHRCLEQWQYRSSPPLHLWLECRRGEVLRVVRWRAGDTFGPTPTIERAFPP
jgi:hypothetical protein